MKLEHIAISIHEVKEIKDFYQEILGFKIIRKFEINRELTARLFGIEQQTEVFLMEREGILLEIFISKTAKKEHLNHVCISSRDRDELIEKIRKNNYKITIINRNNFDLVFIYDRSGNIFEIKESLTE